MRTCFHGGLLVAGLLLFPSAASAYIEAPHTFGRVCHEATNIVLMEVTRVSKERNLILFRKVRDLKGNHPQNEIKHNIGQRGFHEREWKNIMAWAEVGKQAIFFHNGSASETAIDRYWYQCYPEGEWWAMSHAEPFLLRTYYGDIEKLADLVTRVLKGEEVVVPCYADGNKEQFHLRKGKLQRLRASLKRIEYDVKRDFVGFGGDGDELEFKTVELLAASSPGWKFLPAREVGNGDAWIKPGFTDAAWRDGKAPIGYGEEELNNRKGTLIAEKGQDFVFRRSFNVPEDLLRQKVAVFRLNVASDDRAIVYLNGSLFDEDPEHDHEFAYWNRDREIPLTALKPGANTLAIRVTNKAESSDLYLDLEITAEIPLPPRKPRPMTTIKAPATSTPATTAPAEEPRDPTALVVDAKARTVTLKGTVAPRKLPNLDDRYPIEVLATYPAPRGQKAHETVITFRGVKPSDLHAALVSLGLKPGKPALGEGARAEGPELELRLEFTDVAGKPCSLPPERVLLHREPDKKIPAMKWYFTGSVERQPDPEKDDKVYGADLSGTFIALFPVTDTTVIQSHLTMADEPGLKLDTNPKLLPAVDSEIRLVIRVK